MNITVVTERDGEGFESLEITMNSSTKFSVSSCEDSPEDNTLSRNFSDCHDIPSLLRKAWKAGKDGEEFSVTYQEIGEEE